MHRFLALVLATVVVGGATLVLAPAANAACASAPAGLIARWPANGNTNEIAHNRDGTLVGDTTYAAGELAQSFSFDGGGDTVTVPDAPGWTVTSRSMRGSTSQP